MSKKEKVYMLSEKDLQKVIRYHQLKIWAPQSVRCDTCYGSCGFNVHIHIKFNSEGMPSELEYTYEVFATSAEHDYRSEFEDYKDAYAEMEYFRSLHKLGGDE